MPGSLVLVRHAYASEPDPEKYPDDATRPITKKGIKKFKKAAAGLKKLVTPTRVLTSPMARTMQTASLLEWDAGWPAATAEPTLDSRPPEDVVKAIKGLPEWPCVVGLVGHGPDLLILLEYLLTDNADDPPVQVNFDKGGAALVTIGTRLRPKTGTLEWYKTQKDLKKARNDA